MYEKSKGTPLLGCHLVGHQATFGIYAKDVSVMGLTIYADEKQDNLLTEVWLDRENWATGDIFHVALTHIKEGYSYAWHVEKGGEHEKEKLIDPYGYCVIEYPANSKKYCNLVVRPLHPIAKKPSIPWEKTVIYELHVGAFTKHKSANVTDKFRGTFLGLIEKIPYLKALGITTIELLPIFTWNSHTLKTYHPKTGELLQDVWGYNPISFFSPDNRYGSGNNALSAVQEFHQLVEACHRSGLEVILDVVYNHSGEGDERGSLFNFKALGKDTYYRFDEKGRYINASGTGNTLRTTHPVVRQMVIDSLRYWVIHFGVDGFRFDLAAVLGQDDKGRWIEESLLKAIANDPILSHVKLISESWDATGAYYVGKTPYPFKDWSDTFRDTIRRFVRGDEGLVSSLARCIVGEETKTSEKQDCVPIHFITAHDGFTMWDLVSYAFKHNEDNAEENRDGTAQNYSHNFGVEGETKDPKIMTFRRQCVKNYLAMLFLSGGVPMLLMGDECARTQKGNNNAYCQDNEISWLDWDRQKEFKEIFDFTKWLIALRQRSGYVAIQKKSSKVIWHGVKCYQPDWSHTSHSLAWEVVEEGKSFYVISNQYHGPLTFELPQTKTGWEKVMDTSQKQQSSQKIKEKTYIADPFSVSVFVSRWA